MCERGPSAAATRKKEMEEASLVRARPTPSSTSNKIPLPLNQGWPLSSPPSVIGVRTMLSKVYAMQIFLITDSFRRVSKSKKLRSMTDKMKKNVLCARVCARVCVRRLVRQSIPAKRVLSSDRCRNLGRPSRVAGPPAAVAVTTASDTAIVGEVAAHQRTTHHRGAASTSVAHIGGSAGDGAGTAVRLLLALVTTSDQEHGRAVSYANCYGTNTDGCGSSGLNGCRVRLVVVEHVVVSVGGARSRRTSFAAGDVFGTRNDVNGRVDVLGEIVDELLRVVVEKRVWNLDVHAQLVDHGLGVPEPGESRDVAKRRHRVIGHQTRDDDFTGVDLGAIREGGGQQREQLSSSHRVLANKLVVLGVKEADLKENSPFRLSNILRIARADDLGQVRGQSNAACGCDSIRRCASRCRIFHNDSGRQPNLGTGDRFGGCQAGHGNDRRGLTRG
ncbi:hypothetical protein EV126DRAFT_17227 [Verticillium dahliae]|nr:hypothetical protein EV126DRAFT_17227 [Verticillium dahliae]